MEFFLVDTAVKAAVKLGVYPKIVALLNRQIAKREASAIRKHGVEVLAKVDETLTKQRHQTLFRFWTAARRLPRQRVHLLRL
jgi:hypothetical protein